MQIIPFSTIAKQEPFRYSVQLQAPNGSWTSCVGTNSLKIAEHHAKQLVQARAGWKPAETVRIVDMHA